MDTTGHILPATPTVEVTVPVTRRRDYRQYPVFSWPWFWGRTRLFVVLGLAYAGLSGASIGAALNDWWFSLGPIVIYCIQMLLTISVGPFLATLVRYQRWPQRMIHRAMVGAVLLGVMLSSAAQIGVNLYSFKFVMPRLVAAKVAGSAMLDKPFGFNAENIINITFFTIIFLLLNGALALRVYFAEQRDAAQAKQRRELAQLKLQKHESDLQLAILQAQIEPHFLFNTLASVRSLVIQDQARAAAMIDGLANYLRATLPKLRTTASTSTLGEQLDICTSYLELMHLRMSERFSFTVDLPQNLREAAVPALLLLPLVENAVTHGVEPKSGASTIRISVRLEHLASPVLRIEIRDDGVGLNPNQSGKEVGKGMGLANIRNQLNLRYGAQASLEVSSPAGGGTSAVLVIPSDVL